MIVSLEREDDKETAKDVLAILEVIVGSYSRNQSPELLEHIQRLNTLYDTMTEKIRHGDYTEADARRARVDKLLKEVHAIKHYECN